MSDTIQLEVGGGGRASHAWVNDEILPRFGNGPLADLGDATVLPPLQHPPVLTTDSYVVSPVEFPGGNIGHLAVHGTVNDLAVAGAHPRWLTLALIIEEGTPRAVIQRILDSVRDAAQDCGVQIATGDTKVVNRGSCDTLFINTAGLGEQRPGFDLGRHRIRPGDAVLVSGTLGDHGIAVMAARESIAIGEGLASDTAPVHRLVEALLPWGHEVVFMRDPTRGGLAAVLNEVVEGLPLGILLEEAALPFAPPTAVAAELLGLDLLTVASEGRMLAICRPDAADPILAAWNAHPDGHHATRIGTVTDALNATVALNTLAGGQRWVAQPRGELLPRIC
jgi:hydrogenase expression/formation protein HypE